MSPPVAESIDTLDIPDDLSDFYILHTGYLSVLDDELYEEDYDDTSSQSSNYKKYLN